MKFFRVIGTMIVLCILCAAIALTVVPMDTIRKCAVRIVAVRGKKKRAAG